MKNARIRLAPSTIAASSSSLGTPDTKPRSVHTVNGRTNATYTSVSPRDRVAQVPPVEHSGDRDHQRLGGHHLDQQDGHEERHPTTEAEARDGEGGEERGEQGEHHRESGDDQAVAEAGEEVLAVEHGTVVLQRPEREEARSAADVAVGTERRRDHPVHREGDDDDHDERDHVGPAGRRTGSTRAVPLISRPAGTCGGRGPR